MNSCLSQELIVYIKSMLGTPELERLDSALSNLTCTDSTSGGVAGRTDDPTGSHPATHRTAGSSNRLTIDILALGVSIYAYVTPFIIAIGIVGNLISLRVFMSRRMRKMSASLYLACLAVSDSCVLLTYVLFEWLQRGLPSWPGGHAYNLSSAFPGMCQLYAFSSYVFRFMSAWYIVAFNVERYIGKIIII